MSAFLAFLGTFLLSLFVALLAALQLADYFAATEEFGLVLIALLVFVTICLLAFVAANIEARQPRVFNAVAAGLALLAFIPLAFPALVKTAADRSTNPFSIAIENTAVALEFIVPALVAVLVQWGLVRRRWLRLRGEDDLSLWPWIATMVGGLAILNPYGLDVIGQAISYRPTNWLRDMVRTIALGGVAALLAMVFLETYIRGRMLRRRLAQAG
ncbi:MAG: hypothetical protein ABWY14_05155 [Tardiphaga sp.]|jgi:hypothetical protein